MSFTFGQRIGLLEEAVVDALFAGIPALSEARTYDGELAEREKLVEALKTVKHTLPTALVAYSGGDDDAEETALPSQARTVIHSGTLAVMLLADDTRGQYVRRRAGDSTLARKGGAATTHTLMSEVRRLLTGRQFEAVVEGERHVLNPGEMLPVGNEYVERIKGLTAVAVHFSFWFTYEVAPTFEGDALIEAVHFDLEPTNQPAGRGDAPGVHFQQ